MIYVASPYSTSDETLRDIRVERVTEFTVRIIRHGLAAFSPIVYCHPLVARIGTGTDAAAWNAFNMNMLRRSEAVFVLCLPGWEESKGVEVEIRTAELLGIPVFYYDAEFRITDNAIGIASF